MAIEWLRQYIGESEDIAADLGNTATCHWIAVGYVSTQDAITEGLPTVFNAVHPDYGSGDPRRCDRVRIDASGFKVTRVTATYSIPKNGSGTHKPEAPSQTNPTLYSWSTVTEGIYIDRDIDGNLILNGAHQPLDGAAVTRNYKRLTITRWEPSYNPSTALAIENTVNAASFEGAGEGEVKCVSVNPSGSFEASAYLLPIDYTFEFKPAWLWGLGTPPAHPHQVWTKSVSSKAFATINGGAVLMQIVDASGHSVNEALLDTEGKPVEDTYTYISKVTLHPEPNPVWSAKSTPPGATVVTVGDATFLCYTVFPHADYSVFGF